MDVAEVLRRAGLRVTGPRTAVLGVLNRTPHSSVEEIVAAVREQSAVSTQAVYDVLRALHESKIIRRIEPAGSPARYEVQTADNHHHLVCRSCGTITDLECVAGDTTCLRTSDSHGFVVDEAEVTLWGTCAACSTVPALTPS